MIDPLAAILLVRWHCKAMIDALFSPSAARDETDGILSHSSSGQFRKLVLRSLFLSRVEMNTMPFRRRDLSGTVIQV